MAVEIVFSIILGLFILFYLFAAMQMPAIDDTLDILGASGFPQLIGVLALLVLVIITIKAISENKAVHFPLFDRKTREGRLLQANISLLTGYIVLLNILGFAVSTLLYLYIAPSVYGYSKWRLLAAFAVIGAVVLVGVFGTVFYVPLPRGIGIFRELSYLVY